MFEQPRLTAARERGPIDTTATQRWLVLTASAPQLRRHARGRAKNCA
jgi:hypothetical protein